MSQRYEQLLDPPDPLSRWCLDNWTPGGRPTRKPWITSSLPASRPVKVSGRAGRPAAAASSPNTVPRHTLSVPRRRRRSCRHKELVRGATRQSSPVAVLAGQGAQCDGAAAEGWIISRATSTLTPNWSAAKATASPKCFPTRATASVSAYAVRWSPARYTVLPGASTRDQEDRSPAPKLRAGESGVHRTILQCDNPDQTCHVCQADTVANSHQPGNLTSVMAIAAAMASLARGS